jgi:hypothetical protein
VIASYWFASRSTNAAQDQTYKTIAKKFPPESNYPEEGNYEIC